MDPVNSRSLYQSATVQGSRSQESNLGLILTKNASMPLDYNG